MAQPKRRHSPARQGKRRAHDALRPPAIRECSHCHSPALAHRACPSCGFYGGRQVDHTIKPKKHEK